MPRPTPALLIIAGGALAAVAAAAWAREGGTHLAAWSDAGLQLDLHGLAMEARRALAVAAARSPEMVLSLAIVLALPLIWLAGFLVRLAGRLRGTRANGSRLARVRPRNSTVTSPAARAWLEVEASPRRRDLEIGREIVRIGASSENDLAVSGSGVAPFHVLIRRTPEAEFIILDTSEGLGRGLLVNGLRRSACRLRNGDRIEFGGVALTFHRAQARGSGSREPPTSTLVH